VGAFYETLGAKLKAFVNHLGEDAAFSGDRLLQLSAAELTLPGAKPVVCMKTALAAFATIVEQGEGAPEHSADSHYQKFLAIRGEYATLAGQGLPPAELADGKQQLKGQVMLSLESPGARMGRLAGAVLHDDEYRPLDQMLAEIDAVTSEDVAAVAAEFFAPERQTVLRLGQQR